MILMLLSINGIIVGIQTTKMNIGKGITTTILLGQPLHTKKYMFISVKTIQLMLIIQLAHLNKRLKIEPDTCISINR